MDELVQDGRKEGSMAKKLKDLRLTERKMSAALKRSQGCALPVDGQHSRPPTHSEVVAAAWGNVAAENPQVKLRDAQRAIKK